MNIIRTTILLLALAFGAGAVLAQDFNKGAAAYQSGDYAAALQEWRPLAEQGNAEAQGILGAMYNEGKGVLQDYAETVKWFRLAAKQGDADAQSNLGNMHYYGKGVLQDNIRAHMWFNISSSNSHKEAGKWRDKTAAKMTSADISEAQKMARECMNSNYKNCGWRRSGGIKVIELS